MPALTQHQLFHVIWCFAALFLIGRGYLKVRARQGNPYQVAPPPWKAEPRKAILLVLVLWAVGIIVAIYRHWN